MRKIMNEPGDPADETGSGSPGLPVLSGFPVATRILNEADKLFSKYGIKSITMDDLSKNLGISKKTLYQSFASKDELVREWVLCSHTRMDEEISFHIRNAQNAVEEVFINLDRHQEQLMKMNPLIFHDLIKYHPASLELVKNHRSHEEMNWIIRLIKRGIGEGLFRKDVDLEILGRFQIHMRDICMNNEVYPPSQFHIFKLMNEVMLNFVIGLSTLEGHRLINEYKERRRIEQSKTA